MQLFGKILIKDVEGNFYRGDVLVADTFENNSNLKVALMIEFEDKLPDSFLHTGNIDYVVFRTSLGDNLFYGYVSVERIDNEIDEELNDVVFDEDYRCGKLSRFFIFLDDDSSIGLMDNNFALLSNRNIIDEEIKKEMEKPNRGEI